MIYTPEMIKFLIFQGVIGQSCWQEELLGREEPDEVQQGQVQGPASGEEQPHASVQAWGGPAGEQLCGEGPGSAGG